ncbi:hypothetical protein [Dyella acidiphila]|uniref:Sel1 repeat family protein n=1 Tax=Dyella acidiphila TaxID=2775866 RepID=A0ABR9G4S5_9GAMM|nr:hypothetical protein [Dyella acidiphila]MBE1159052.1 hypothetical protein [Dyella acidiphila]
MVRAMMHFSLRSLVLGVALIGSVAANAADSATGTCTPVLEKLLPGEYHYCVAVHDWQRGNNRSGLSEAKYAATWGEKRAQFALGVDYFNGRRGLTADKVQGLAWLTLAAERKDPYYASILSSARAQSTPAQQQQADALVATMLPDYGDAKVAAYAERRFRAQWWEIRQQVWDTASASHMDPWSINTAFAIDGLGVVQPMIALRKLQDAGTTYFDGWGGHVTVGPLIPLSKLAPGAASRESASQH